LLSFGSGSVGIAEQSSISAEAAIADTGTAVIIAGREPVAGSIEKPTGVTSKVPKENWTIAIDNESTVNASKAA
jgi:hypothetical protein